jgi:hypothetical protein
MIRKMVKGTAVLWALFVAACGGNSGEPSLKNYQLSFSIDASTAQAPVNGIDLTIQLPKEAQVATATDGTGRILETALSPGRAVSGTTLVVGHYASSSHRVQLSLTTAATTAWNGEFARLTVAIPTRTAITEQALLSTVGGNFPQYKVVGVTAPTRSAVSLTDHVRTTVALLRH